VPLGRALHSCLAAAAVVAGAGVAFAWDPVRAPPAELWLRVPTSKFGSGKSSWTAPAYRARDGMRCTAFRAIAVDVADSAAPQLIGVIARTTDARLRRIRSYGVVDIQSQDPGDGWVRTTWTPSIECFRLGRAGELWPRH
jgi:hypothetical protein